MQVNIDALIDGKYFLKRVIEHNPLYILELYARHIIRDEEFASKIMTIRLGGRWGRYYLYKKIIALYKKGFKIEQILNILHADYDTIRYCIDSYKRDSNFLYDLKMECLKEDELKRRVKRLKERGLPYKNICKLLHKGYRVIRDILIEIGDVQEYEPLEMERRMVVDYYKKYKDVKKVSELMLLGYRLIKKILKEEAEQDGELTRIMGLTQGIEEGKVN